ncbi:hypothetical protein B9Z19DRAFT_658754 [Tuber borchii]|uniref:dUTPase-like domain-containing protein n=1 Tax=Tuber borchii TaxID=42251 RepID=A0A2T7A026_TUBBO|nr:hypothetical protein B9Z19DRAFT_658754 [Tuber borchii]
MAQEKPVSAPYCTSPPVLKRPPTEDLLRAPKKQGPTGLPNPPLPIPAKILTPLAPGRSQAQILHQEAFHKSQDFDEGLWLVTVGRRESRPRAGLASKNSIDVGAGVIEANCRGEFKVLLFNHGDADWCQ